MATYEECLRQKLAPETIGMILVRAGCFLSAYELIKSEIIDKVHSFFWCGFKDGKDLYDEARYQRDVLSRDPKSRYRASSAWLVEMEALTSEQVDQLEAIHRHRQEIAHELPKLLIDPDFDVKTDLLVAALGCLRSLGIFWGSISVDTDPDYDGVEVDYGEIKSGSFLLMEYLLPLCGVGAAVGASDRSGDEDSQ